MPGEVRKAIGALEVLSGHFEKKRKGLYSSAANLAGQALEAIIKCIKELEENLFEINERISKLEERHEQKPAGFLDKD